MTLRTNIGHLETFLELEEYFYNNYLRIPFGIFKPIYSNLCTSKSFTICVGGFTIRRLKAESTSF